MFEFRAWFEVYWKKLLLSQAIDSLEIQFKEIPDDLKHGYLTNISNEMDTCIESINRRIDRYNSRIKDGTARVCPHCGKVWRNMVRVCGDNPVNNTCLGRTCFEMKTFTISIHDRHQLVISKNTHKKENNLKGKNGCGHKLTWNDMKIVSLVTETTLKRQDSLVSLSNKRQRFSNDNQVVSRMQSSAEWTAIIENFEKVRFLPYQNSIDSSSKVQQSPSKNTETVSRRESSTTWYVKIEKNEIDQKECDVINDKEKHIQY